MTTGGNGALRLVLGDQLFPPDAVETAPGTPVFMAEDMGLCTEVRHHQQKIVLFLAAMRCYCRELRDAGHRVHYIKLDPHDERSYEQKLLTIVERTGARSLEYFEIEDRGMEQRIRSFARSHGLDRHELPSPKFLTDRSELRAFFEDRSSARMADFYRLQRQRLRILVDDDGQPVGGQWSFDEQNRKKLPADESPPGWPPVPPEPVVAEVTGIVSKHFSDHPGKASEFAWPVTRTGALEWLTHFVDERLAKFGPYEDAISTRSESVYHSMLSPLLNIGLLTPREAVDQVLAACTDHEIPINSQEGFVRQLIGWREFVRGVDRWFGDVQENRNFWRHERELTADWYDGTTGIPVLDDTIRLAERVGWTHHITRLMVVGNLMTLCEIRPQSAYRWFMEMYVDSAAWVMGPNVYGMGLYSDGGIFATKPYICGSNYLLKMSDYGRGDWCDVVDGLYWRFIDKHLDYFVTNPRLALMGRALERLSADRRSRIFDAAERFIDRVTVLAAS